MTPEERERRRRELRAKAGISEQDFQVAPPAIQAPDPYSQQQVNPRRAELRAKAGLDEPAQPAIDSGLASYSLPKKLFGFPMPYAGGPTETVSNAAQGLQVQVPINAPEAVRRGIVSGAQRGHRDKQQTTRLATRGATLAATNQSADAISRAIGAVTGDGARQDRRTLERTAAFATGAEDFGSFGYSDEIAGLAGGPEALQNQRQAIDDAYTQHPVSTMAGGATTLVMPGQTIKGASTGQKILSGMGRGGLFGALYGSGSGEDIQDRATKALIYGGGSAVVGGGFVAGGRGLDFLARKFPGSAELRALGSKILGGKNLTTVEVKALEEAITEVQRVAAVNGRKVDRGNAKQELIGAIQQAQRNDFMFEALGEEGVIAAQGAAQPGMAGATDIAEALGARGEQQYARVNAAVSKLAGGQDIESSLATLAATKTEEASPVYQEAFSVPLDVNSPHYQAVTQPLSLPDFQRGRAAGERILQLERNDPSLKFTDLNPFEQIDYIKKGLDAEIGKLIRAGDNTTARALTGSKNKWLSAVDQMNPRYAEARRIWGGAEAQRNAILLGESVFGAAGTVPKGQKWRDLKADYESMSESEQIAFSIGLFERAIETAGDKAATATGNSVGRGFMTPNTEARIRQVLPAEQADEFLGLMQREYTQQMTTNRVLPAAGSKTGSVVNATDAVLRATSGLKGAVGELAEPQRLLGRVQQGAREWMQRNAGKQKALTDFLLKPADDPGLARALGVSQPPPGGALPPPGGPTPSAAIAASKGGYSTKDKAIDAGALGIATVPHAVGPADAQQASMDGELQAAQERVAYVENELVGSLEADLQMLSDPNADPRELQGILQRRVNPDLAIDGVIGPQTLSAINDMRGQLQTELETARGELDTARQRLLEVEQRQIFADNRTAGWMQTAQDQLPLVGTGLGALIGLRGRAGAVNKSRQAAIAAEQRANALLNSKPVGPKSITGPNSLNERAPNINEFWRQGGAGENVPFKTRADGTWINRPNAVEPSNLYQASNNPFRTTDAGWIAGGLGEAGLSTQYLNEAKAGLEQAKADVERYRAEGNNAGLEQAMAQVKQKEAEVAVLTSLQRLGLGVAAFRGMAALKSPYAAAKPNIRGAETEQALLRQKIRDNKTKPPGSASPDN